MVRDEIEEDICMAKDVNDNGEGLKAKGWGR